MSSLEKQAKQLVACIESLPDFEFVEWQNADTPVYDHMGATISDGILQAGINYKNVVLPRVEHLLAEYPNDCTTGQFLRILEAEGPEQVLNFRGKKPQIVLAITRFFNDQPVQTTTDLQNWLQQDANKVLLRQQKGIGPKSVDYFCRLAGLQAIAIDVHLLRFLAMAGIHTSDYETAKAIYAQAADLMNIPRGVVDHSVWKYMSNRQDN